MKRILQFLAVAPFLIAPAWAQQDYVVNTTISTGVCGAFWVDGVRYERTATFLWPENTKHFVTLDLGITNAPYYSRCVLQGGWTNNLNMTYEGETISVVADRNVTKIDATTKIEHKVSFDFLNADPRVFACPASTLPYPPPQPWDEPETGYILIDGVCFASSANFWHTEGTTITAIAHPPKYQVFRNWILTSNQELITTHIYTFTVRGPMAFVAEFDPASRIKFSTQPAGMLIMLDGQAIRTPYEVDWAYNSTHTVGPVSPQSDTTGGVWVWDSWSDGGTATHKYKVPLHQITDSLAVKYVPGKRVGFNTQPFGLKLMVDGSDAWPNYNFVWGLGTKHIVSAPAEQLDASSRKWVFNSWSNGGPVEQEIVVSANPDDQGLLALYDILGRLRVDAVPLGVNVTVDGQSCPTPCDVHRRAGQKATIAAPASFVRDEGTRMKFLGWADGGPAERTWTATADAEVITANYQAEYRLAFRTEPAGAGTFKVEPASADGFYPAGTEVTITVQPKTGYEFRFWEGDLIHGRSPTTVTMSGPVNLIANFEKVEVYGPAAVRNAAGETPDPEVAPGSLITIYGENISPYSEQGPENPLAQSIAGISVQLGERLLPLVFISPNQINAQLLSDLPEGEHMLLIRSDRRPDVSALFKVKRSAPGLFGRVVNEKVYASAFHQDGTQVTAESPARRGEVITILGTGFGPYKQGALDGFVVPEGVVLELEDAAEIRVGNTVLKPESVRAANGYVGTVAVRLKIADPLPAASTVEIRAVVNGRTSNTVLLPLQ